MFISSLKLKAQVSFSYHLLFLYLAVKFSHFHLLQNYWAKFNQTWHKTTFCSGGQVCSNEGQHPFQGEIIAE